MWKIRLPKHYLSTRWMSTASAWAHADLLWSIRLRRAKKCKFVSLSPDRKLNYFQFTSLISVRETVWEWSLTEFAVAHAWHGINVKSQRDLQDNGENKAENNFRPNPVRKWDAYTWEQLSKHDGHRLINLLPSFNKYYAINFSNRLFIVHRALICEAHNETTASMHYLSDAFSFGLNKY